RVPGVAYPIANEATAAAALRVLSLVGGSDRGPRRRPSICRPTSEWGIPGGATDDITARRACLVFALQE
ncbi:MAG TPA: hypothetical protein VMB72_16145, partial [Acidimicrobiales bacterium]|nr:hypothetical protein [Acidimicrobiales bacterium]